ncbi:hypothetical protein NRIC_12300 [Enterococcus florum]|uniref:Lipoprotein n=1 Tax=Enterococcus florum TaxID=2480627 RepID=A0A4V0WPC1_9ENTE|nr:hypothetical protein [Enterococcus florum]GCF93339.1 hypothetical protein NRIC_12300 [Enterococcus florum]
MKKIGLLFLVCFTFLFSACSNDKNAETADSSVKQETKASKEKVEKEAKKKKEAEKAEKEKQELIAQKVKEADDAMKAAEANPTDETFNAAKAAVEAIPDGNEPLQKRLESVLATLDSIKQQAAEAQRIAEEQTAVQNQQQAQTQQQQQEDPTLYWNNLTPDQQEQTRRMEAEANAQWHAQNDADQKRDQFVNDFQQQHGRPPTSGEIQYEWAKEQGLVDY